MHPQLPPTWKSIRTSDSDALQIAYSSSPESTPKGVNSRSKYVTKYVDIFFQSVELTEKNEQAPVGVRAIFTVSRRVLFISLKLEPT